MVLSSCLLSGAQELILDFSHATPLNHCKNFCCYINRLGFSEVSYSDLCIVLWNFNRDSERVAGEKDFT
jgi:hypothetical protein